MATENGVDGKKVAMLQVVEAMPSGGQAVLTAANNLPGDLRIALTGVVTRKVAKKRRVAGGPEDRPKATLRTPSRQFCRVVMRVLSQREFAEAYVSAFDPVASLRPAQVDFLGDPRIFMTDDARAAMKGLTNGEHRAARAAWRQNWLRSLGIPSHMIK